MRELMMRGEEQRMNGLHRKGHGKNGIAAEEKSVSLLKKSGTDMLRSTSGNQCSLTK
jgi:hypothetical protein